MTDHADADVHNQPEPISTQPEPEHIARAALTLARVIAGRPPARASLAAGSALAMLSDVHPPYPPHPEPGDLVPLPADAGIRDAFDALTEAAEHSVTAEELARVALAGRELRLYLAVVEVEAGDDASGPGVSAR